MRRKIARAIKREAVRLRREERLSLKAIQERLPEHLAYSTLSLWLRDYPLTEEELRARAHVGGVKGNARRWARRRGAGAGAKSGHARKAGRKR